MTVSIPNAKLRTRRRGMLTLFIVFGLFGLPAAMLALLVALVSSGPMIAVTIGYFAGLFALNRVLMRPVPRNGALRADENGVFLDGKQLAKRSKLTHGHVVKVGEQSVLRLLQRDLNGPPIDIEVADEAQALELLAALRLDRTVAEYTMRAGVQKGASARMAMQFVGSLVFGFFGMLFAIALIPRGTFGYHALLAVIPILSWALGMGGAVAAAMARELSVAVGEDGLWVRRPLVSKRFLSFREVKSVEQEERDITIHLVDGTSVKLHEPVENATSSADLIARIRAGIAAFEAAPARTGEAVARNGRSIAEWIATASKRHERSANYRAAVVPQAELWRIVEDASAEPTERAGAALALRPDLDPEGKIRLRVAAGACAEQKLRIALESVGTADDDALAEALEPLEERKERRLSR